MPWRRKTLCHVRASAVALACAVLVTILLVYTPFSRAGGTVLSGGSQYVAASLRKTPPPPPGSVPPPDLPTPDACLDYPFRIELLTPKITADIKARPETYPLEQPVRLKVLSARPGWRLEIKATPLSLSGDKTIQAGEVNYINGDQSLPLMQPVLVADGGPPGETELALALGLLTRRVHFPGLYTGCLLINAQSPSSPNAVLVKVPFEVNVRMEAGHTLSGNKLYFHLGNIFTAQDVEGVIKGRVDADSAVSLTIESTQGPIHHLIRRKKFGAPDPGGAPRAVIPVSLGTG